MDVRFSGFGASNSAVQIVGAWADGKLQPRALAVNAELGGTLTAAMGRSRFNGQKGQWLEAQGPHGRVALAGLGAAGKLDAGAAEAIGAGAVARYLTSGEKELAFAIEAQGKGAAPAELAVALALGASLRAYRFDKYRTKLKAEARPSLTTITVMTSDPKGAAKLWKDASALIDGVYLTRDLVSEPANVIYPESFAKKALELKALGVEVEVLGEKEMKKLGMGALLGVGQGSAKESQLVVMQWKGAGKAPPVALVGKGVTFDTGGISLKPGDGMWDMKWDMGGAGAVIGAMKALAGRKAKANVVGVCGLVENMPDGDAQRPGDIVTSMSGQTIEVWNTDAEGRLVLADALHYTAERFKPAYMIDLATLTGAIMISLGVDMAGLFSNDDRFASMLEKAGKASGEPVWRMPLSESLDRALDSQCADMKNITGARNGGSIVGAMFLKRFVGETKWAHLDIAGVAWSGKAGTVAPEGATGFGVRLLDRLIQDNFER